MTEAKITLRADLLWRFWLEALAEEFEAPSPETVFRSQAAAWVMFHGHKPLPRPFPQHVRDAFSTVLRWSIARPAPRPVRWVVARLFRWSSRRFTAATQAGFHAAMFIYGVTWGWPAMPREYREACRTLAQWTLSGGVS